MAKPYRRQAKFQEQVFFTVPLVDTETGEEMECRVTARNLKRHQFAGLDDFLVNTAEAKADGSGDAELFARRTKLKQVVVAIEDSPDLDEEFDGDIARYLDASGNEDLCWYMWMRYVAAINSPHLFRAFPARGETADGDAHEGAPEESTAPTRVSGLSGGEAAAA